MKQLRWFVCGTVAAITVAWVAMLIHRSGKAPLGLVSIGIGVVLGLALGWIAAKLNIRQSRGMIIGTVALGFLTVAAQHAWLYREFRQQWHDSRQNSPQVAMFRAEEPWSPVDYLRHEMTSRQVALWCVDAALIVAAAVGSLLVIHKQEAGESEDEDIIDAVDKDGSSGS